MLTYKFVVCLFCQKTLRLSLLIISVVHSIYGISSAATMACGMIEDVMD